MTVFIKRVSGAAGALLVVIALTSSVSSAEDFSLQQKINACHTIADRDARINCYDKLAKPEAPGAALKAPLMPVSPRPQASAAPNVAPQALPAPPPPAPSVAQTAPPSLPQTSESLRSDTDEIQLAVVNASILGDGRLRLVMSDGITWDQTEDRPIHKMPAAGDFVKITRGWFGYTCKLSGRDKFHCKPPYGLDGKMHRG